ncbi:uncharacterized protein TNCV_2264211 [Trichonephila clavipes]|nr:uncharacterized protein TNCV_2264211 [Trichonephila clavipes]
MATSKQKTFCVLRFAKTKSAITAQREFRIKEKYRTTKAVTGSAYLDTLQLWLIPQLEESEPNNFIWQQDGAPPYSHLSVRDWLYILYSTTGLATKKPPEKASIAWPPRSPNLTPDDFYLWGFFKDCNYVPSQPADLSDLIHRMKVNAARISSYTHIKVRDEVAFRLDLCRAMNGAHVEHM